MRRKRICRNHIRRKVIESAIRFRVAQQSGPKGPSPSPASAINNVAPVTIDNNVKRIVNAAGKLHRKVARNACLIHNASRRLTVKRENKDHPSARRGYRVGYGAEHAVTKSFLRGFTRLGAAPLYSEGEMEGRAGAKG